jgi:hypothetical protein
VGLRRRTDPPAYARAATQFGAVAALAFAGYAASFGIAFTYEGPYYALLPIFGITSALVIWSAFVFALRQLRSQPVVTTVHVLLVGALFVASLGATMGVLLGLEYELGTFFVPAPIDRIGSHAGVMDSYLLLAFAGVLELLLRPGAQARRRWPGLTQAALWVLSGVAILAGLLLGITPLAGVSALTLLVGLIFYLARIGWRSFRVNPFRPGHAAGLFWGGFWFPAYVLMFIAAIPLFIAGTPLPAWFGVVFAHTFFIGAASNLIFTLLSARAGPASPGRAQAEAVGFWLINLGLIAFLAGEVLYDVPYGALVMGAGVLLELFTLLVALAQRGRAGDSTRRARPARE